MRYRGYGAEDLFLKKIIGMAKIGCVIGTVQNNGDGTATFFGNPKLTQDDALDALAKNIACAEDGGLFIIDHDVYSESADGEGLVYYGYMVVTDDISKVSAPEIPVVPEEIVPKKKSSWPWILGIGGGVVALVGISWAVTRR